jgi:serine/threonine protein kinase/Tol biopolymer transport system component
MTLDSGSRLAHYEILSPLGAGGMGEVFRARDTKLGREVAIKVLPEDFTSDEERLGRFDREARLLASLNHPHVAAIHGFEEDSGTRFLVMELASGQTIQDRLKLGPIPVDEAVAIAGQIIDALESAHDKGIIHRDLKPANVMIDEDGKVKVLDFGLAKALDVEEGPDSGISNSPTMVRAATQAGMILGTAGYMSPEQAKGKKVDRRADIWAFGVVLFEMMVGDRIFEGETVSETLAQVIMRDPDWSKLPKSTPPHVRRLLERCLTRDPKQRLQAIGEARIMLEGATDVVSGGEAAVPMQSVKPRSSFVPWAVAALSLIGLVAAVVLLRPAPPTVIRAEIPPPAGTSFYLHPSGPGIGTLSPDGTHIVFSAQSEDGGTILYVRALSDAAARPLNGTEGARYPFWSPDSRHVGFFQQGEGGLRKIDRAGGPPVSLCAAPNGKGGSWSPEGVIVFTPNSSNTLQRVSAAGGEPTELTTLDGSKHNSHRHPRFLPDGKHFLFFARGTSPENNEIMIGSIDGGEPVSLVKTRTQAEYANGYLFFVREQSLMAQPFDPAKRVTTGEAVPIAERIAVASGASMSAFSLSANGVLAYSTGLVTTDVAIEVRDALGQVTSTLAEPASYRHAVISPDGRLAATKVMDQSFGTGDIWIFELERNLRSRFTFDPRDDDHPIWHPDGVSIVYESASGESKRGLFRKAVGGTEDAQLLYESEIDVTPTSFSPDGKQLQFTLEKGPPELWVLDLESGKASPVRESGFIDGGATFSPDGKWVAYHSNESGTFQVYVIPWPDRGRRWQVSKESGVYPFWTSNGREIAFVSGSGQITKAKVATSSGTFVVESVENLFETSGPTGGGAEWSVTADGSTFLTIPDTLSKSDPGMKLTFNWPEDLKRSEK